MFKGTVDRDGGSSLIKIGRALLFRFVTPLARRCHKKLGCFILREWKHFSDIVLPKNPTQVAEYIVSQDKNVFRGKAGSIIDAAAGQSAASLGQPLNLNTLISAYQHWAASQHKAQSCPHNRIDASSCNRELRKTTPLWLLCDSLGKKYDAEETSLPDGFDEKIRISDHFPIHFDKNKRKPKSKAKNPPTDVDGQANSFIKKAKTTAVRMSLLPLLYNCLQSVVTKLMGYHNKLLVFSVEVYTSLECPPPMNNSLLEILGGVVHAQNFVIAGVQLRKYQDDHLVYMMKKIVSFYSNLLGIPRDFESKMLQIRSGRDGMSEEMKQLLRDQGNPLQKWLDESTAEMRKARSKAGHAAKNAAGKSLSAAKTAKTKKGSNPVYDHFEMTTVGKTKLRKNKKFTNERQVMACKHCTAACNNETEKIWATILSRKESYRMKRHLIGDTTSTNPCEHCPEDVQKLLRASTKVFNKSK